MRGHRCSVPLLALLCSQFYYDMGTQVYENAVSCSVIDLGIFSLANSTACNFLYVNVNHLFYSQKYIRVRIIKVLSGEPVQTN